MQINFSCSKKDMRFWIALQRIGGNAVVLYIFLNVRLPYFIAEQKNIETDFLRKGIIGEKDKEKKVSQVLRRFYWTNFINTLAPLLISNS